MNTNSSAPRLHPDRLAALPASVLRPAYDRTRLQPGIVHLGIGAFMRAHLAAYNEDALSSGGDGLRSGMFVDVRIVRPEKTTVVTVPATAVVHAPYGDSVFVVEERKPFRCVLDVGIDPEFSMKQGGIPGQRIGTFDAADVNYAAEFLQVQEYKHVQRWTDTLMARPAVQAARAAWPVWRSRVPMAASATAVRPRSVASAAMAVS